MKGIHVISPSIIILMSCLTAVGILTGFIGIHYPRVTENEPLTNPVKVLKVDEDHLHLVGGRVIKIDYWRHDGNPSALMNLTKHQVEVHQDSSGVITVYGNAKGWICGTPWARGLFTIPLIPDDVYRNRREFLAEGSESVPEGTNQ